ncbi:MAG: hypothetical protein AB7L17_11445 [Ilumatobacteraceae bacterium]
MFEPALSLTDLVLGVAVVVIALVLRARRLPAQWLPVFWWTAGAACAGFVHHGWVSSESALADPSAAAINGLVIMALSYLLAATVHEVVGPGRRDVFWPLRLASLVVYAALALAGRPGAGSLVLAESVTMAIVVGLWVRALLAGVPGATRVVWALVVSAVAGCTTLIPERVTGLVGLDPSSLYHLTQIPGLALLAWAIDRMHRDPARASSLVPMPSPTTAIDLA